MAFATRSTLIPHRKHRSFAHAADIYRSTILAMAGDGKMVSQIHFELRQTLGSYVEIEVGEGRPPSGSQDTVATCELDSRPHFAILKNRDSKISFAASYSFDEDAVGDALRSEGGTYSFRHRFHESNIHMLLSPIKFILPSWPERPDDARVVRMSFMCDVQTLDIEKFSLRTRPRQSFCVTNYFYSDEPIGEVMHFFLNGGRP